MSLRKPPNGPAPSGAGFVDGEQVVLLEVSENVSEDFVPESGGVERANADNVCGIQGATLGAPWGEPGRIEHAVAPSIVGGV